MDLRSIARNNSITELAERLSFALQIEGIHHFLHLPGMVNDGIALISDVQHDFVRVSFNELAPKNWEVVISTEDEDGALPFFLMRIMNPFSVKRLPLNIREAVTRILPCVQP